MKINPLLPRYVGKLDLAGKEAGGTFEFAIPRDRFIDHIIMKTVLGTLSGGTSPSWVSGAGDKITYNIRVLVEGSPIQDLPEAFWKLWGAINEGKKIATGVHKIYFKPALIKLSGELPAWDFTSILVQVDVYNVGNTAITTGAPTGWGTTYIEFTIAERPWTGESLEGWKLLRARIPQYKKSGNNDTGDFLYELDRVYCVYLFMFCQDDDGVPTEGIFDRLWLIGQTREREFRYIDNMRTAEIGSINDLYYFMESTRTTRDAGFFILEFPEGIDTAFFTTLRCILNIPTAIGVAGLKIAHFYIV